MNRVPHLTLFHLESAHGCIFQSKSFPGNALDFRCSPLWPPLQSGYSCCTLLTRTLYTLSFLFCLSYRRTLTVLGSQGHSNEVSMSGGTAAIFHLELESFNPKRNPQTGMYLCKWKCTLNTFKILVLFCIIYKYLCWWVLLVLPYRVGTHTDTQRQTVVDCRVMTLEALPAESNLW